MPAPFFSYGGARQNSGFVYLVLLRNLIIRVCVNSIVLARFKNENNAVFGVFLQRLLNVKDAQWLELENE